METKFNCSIPALTPTVITLWDNCEVHLSVLATYKSKYTPGLCASRKDAMNAAAAMPDQAARSAVHERIRLRLVDGSKTCMRLWQNLKSYCRDSYTNKEELEVQLKSAGWEYYDFAASSWPSTQSLMTSGLNFIDANIDTLKESGYMPDSFRAAFAYSKALFTNDYNEFRTAITDASTSTAARTEALNQCYADVISLCLDSQDCFANNEIIKAQFVFDNVLSMVAPAGASAAAFTITNAQTKRAIIAEVQVQGSDKSVTTDSSTGKCEVSQLAAGNTTFIIMADGFVKQTITSDLTTGTTTRIPIEMTPQFTANDTPQPEPLIVNSQ